MKALLLVNIQNDFLPGGALAVPDSDKIIPVVNGLLPQFSLVVATQAWYPKDHGSFASNHPDKKMFERMQLNGLPQILWPAHCVQGTAGAELAPGLPRERIAKIFLQGTDTAIDGCSGLFDDSHRKLTGLGEWLKAQGVTEVFVCGLATDYCVKFTALDAAKMGFKTHFIEDASRGVNLQVDDVKKAIAEMNQAGVVTVQSDELLRPGNFLGQVIVAPQALPENFGQPSIFLAGSIDNGAAEDWQKTFIAACRDEAITLLTPRRESWSAAPVLSAADATFREQVEWELDALERADVIAMYFSPGSKAPISLLEFGLWARSGKLVVACPENYWRRGNVEIVCARYRVPFVNDLSALIRTARERAATSRKNGRPLLTNQFLSLIREGHWEYVDRVNATGAAIILAVTPEQNILLVEQYRIPVHARTIELPAGIIGDEPGSSNESHAEAARRELLEETGYAAECVEALTTGAACSGITSERVTLFRGSGLRRVGQGGGVANENITVHEVPLAGITTWLEARAQAGVLIDPKVYSGLFFLTQKSEPRSTAKS